MARDSEGYIRFGLSPSSFALWPEILDREEWRRVSSSSSPLRQNNCTENADQDAYYALREAQGRPRDVPTACQGYFRTVKRFKDQCVPCARVLDGGGRSMGLKRPVHAL